MAEESQYRRHSDQRIEALTAQVARLDNDVAAAIDGRFERLTTETSALDKSLAVLTAEVVNSGKRQEEMLREIRDLGKRMNGHDRKFAWLAGAIAVLTAVWEAGKEYLFAGGHHQ